MKMLSPKSHSAATTYIHQEGRALEMALLRQWEQGSAEDEIIDVLSAYQNHDGGFGHGLEADFRMPASSPMATSVALQTLKSIDYHEKARTMIKQAISYFEKTYNEERNGWFAVPSEVNNHPHAFWWTVHDNGKSWIDDHWGNPSAEIIGYLIRYDSFLKSLDSSFLAEKALDHFISLEKYESEHEIYCYLRFFEMHPHYLTHSFLEKLKAAVRQVVVSNPEEWKNYVPFPLKFQPSPDSLDLGLTYEELERNLDYFVDLLHEKPYLEPTWSWNNYMDTWKTAKKDWQGVLTLEVLEYLNNYDRIKS